ncbi:ATP-dependent DNA helicase [Rarobacter faecitabidus]
MGGQPRAGQQDMADAVAEVITDGGTLLVQAGTGTGKSLGYLIPAMLAAREPGHRAVVSTSTIALQRQLLAKDIPLVAEQIKELRGGVVTSSALKGWSNYACRNKVEGGYPDEESSLFDLPETSTAGATSALGAEVTRLREWAADTTTGDRDDLDWSASDRAWRQVSVSTSECLNNRCTFWEECFAKLAREDASRADVVVTNHAMLGIAAAGNESIIPPHSTLVIDEAHDLVARVTSSTTQELSVGTVTSAAKRLRRHGTPGASKLDEAARSLAEQLVQFDASRLTTGLPDELASAVELVQTAARSALSDLKDGDTQAVTHKVARAAVTDIFEIAERLLVGGEWDVLWTERRPGDATASLKIAALDVSAAIREQILKSRTVVMCSATLILGGAFEPFARTVGLFSAQEEGTWAPLPADSRSDDLESAPPTASSRWRGVNVSTPFDYRRQGILFIARHLPEPGRAGLTPEQLDLMAELIEAAGGRTLGLFTSKRGAIEATEAMRDRLSLPVLSQDEGYVPELIARFKQEEQTSLFGTMSLWQGIDVPGDSCRLVIIDRIPFARRDDPIVSARLERVTKKGGNGFQTVALPHAALPLAQGAGRLIRSSTDRGVVAILDPRLRTKGYGSYFIRSLPGFWQTDSLEKAAGALRRLGSGS